MEAKENVNESISGIGTDAKAILNKAKDKIIQAADQNDDGKFDMEDVSAIASSVSDAVKQKAQAMKELSDEKKRENELKRLQPLFLDAFSEPEHNRTTFLRIAGRDDKRRKSLVCQGSIGFTSTHTADKKAFSMVNLFQDSLEQFSYTFIPNDQYDIYIVDPVDSLSFIASEKYFDTLEQAAVAELQKIAEDLGATFFRVTNMEEVSKSNDTEIKTEESSQAGKKPTAKKKKAKEEGEKEDTYLSEDVSFERKTGLKEYRKIKIASTSRYAGHSPVQPELHYWAKDPEIVGLVNSRMDNPENIIERKYILTALSSIEITEKDAAKIDAVMNDIKGSVKGSFSSKVRNESHRYFEYEISFE